MTQRVFVDANVFYSKTQMDWLFFLKINNDDMFQVHSTEDVFAEVASNMRESNPRLPGHVVRRRVELMRAVVDEVLETFPGDLSFSGRDQNDYHVHAAAVASKADFLLTNDDPKDINASEEHYEVIHPDAFFLLVADSAPPEMLYPIIKEQMEYWSKNPSNHQLDEALRRAKCPEFANRIRSTLQQVALQRERMVTSEIPEELIPLAQLVDIEPRPQLRAEGPSPDSVAYLHVSTTSGGYSYHLAYLPELDSEQLSTLAQEVRDRILSLVKDGPNGPHTWSLGVARPGYYVWFTAYQLDPLLKS